MKNQHMIELDILRIIALFSVMVLHTACYDFGGSNYIVNTYIKLSQWGVPLFLMITGNVFLDNNKDYSIFIMFSKYIKRLFIVYIGWSFLYSMYNTIVYNGTKKTFILGIFNGEFHLWYLIMCIGIYMIIPILKIIVNNTSKYVMLYIIALSILWTFIIPVLNKIEIINILIGQAIKNMNYTFIYGYVTFVLLGFYLSHYKIEYKKIKYMFFITIFVTVFCIYGELSNIEIIQLCISSLGSFSIISLCISVYLFCLLKYKIKELKFNKKIQNIIIYISQNTFTMYLLHEFVNKIFNLIGYNISNFNPIWSIPVISISVFLISLIFSIIINFLYKYVKNNIRRGNFYAKNRA